MSQSQIKILFAGFLLFCISSQAKAISAVGSGMEAQGLCSAGRCIASMKVPGVERVEEVTSQLLHHVNIYGKDDRSVQSRVKQTNGYAAIGRVLSNRPYKDKEGRTYAMNAGTAFLVSPCIALTNYHVVFGREDRETVIPWMIEIDRQFRENRDSKGIVKLKLPKDRNYTMTFLVGEKSDGSFRKQVVGRPYAFGDASLGFDGSDWVALKFDEPNCPGSDKEIGWLPIANAETVFGKNELHTAAFPGDFNPLSRTDVFTHGKLVKSGKCSSYGDAYGVGKNAFEHDCATRPGNSGGPILGERNGQLVVVGMDSNSIEERTGILPKVKGVRPSEESIANIAVGVNAFLNEVQPLIDEDLTQHGINLVPNSSVGI